jgi:hypothetical protein
VQSRWWQPHSLKRERKVHVEGDRMILPLMYWAMLCGRNCDQASPEFVVTVHRVKGTDDLVGEMRAASPEVFLVFQPYEIDTGVEFECRQADGKPIPYRLSRGDAIPFSGVGFVRLFPGTVLRRSLDLAEFLRPHRSLKDLLVRVRYSTAVNVEAVEDPPVRIFSLSNWSRWYRVTRNTKGSYRISVWKDPMKAK